MLESCVEELATSFSVSMSIDDPPSNRCRRESVWTSGEIEREEKRTILNSAMESIADGRCSPVKSTLNANWDEISTRQQNYYTRKAKEVIEAALAVIAPGQEQELWNAVKSRTILGVAESSDTESLTSLYETFVTAYNTAESWQTKRQILSLIVDKVTKEELQLLIPGLTVWRIDQARRHNRECGPGQPVPNSPISRVRLDPIKTDHFIDFISSPMFLQDVAFGTKTMTLSDGEKLFIPAAIRTAIPSRIVKTYITHCERIGFEPAKERTLYRIIQACSASLQKSLQGLDNYTADGSEAFETMQDIVKTLAEHGLVDSAWVQSTKQALKEGKNYLKVDFKSHVSQSDWCADHCMTFALSDCTDTTFKSTCNHDHDMICERCFSLQSSLESIGVQIKNSAHLLATEDLDRLLFEYRHAHSGIVEWKKHILRTVNQELAKDDILQLLDQSNCLIIMDWAMKFLPVHYREKMSDFFGKRGRSWHVSAIITKNSSGDFDVDCLVHLFDACKQDWLTVACVLEHVLLTIKKENKDIDTVYLKSDNAGCYHNPRLLLSLPDMGRKAGLRILRYDFSDPQSGKDVCDRKMAHMKAHIRRFVNEGNNVTTASEMKKALESYGGVRGCRFAVAELHTEGGELPFEVKWNGISFLYNFSYLHPDRIKFWRAFGIGQGKQATTESFGETPYPAARLNITEGFGSAQYARGSFYSRPTGSSSHIFNCQESGCVASFPTLDEAEKHMDTGKHVRMLERECSYDTIKKKWAQKMTGISSVSRSHAYSGLASSSLCSSQSDHISEMGWALKTQKQAVRMTKEVKVWLTKKFESGRETGPKADASTVAREMQYLRDENKCLVFSPDEWRTAKQISSFFSRLSQKDKKAKYQPGILDEEEDTEDGPEEEARFRYEIYEAVDLTHPITYSTRNICELARTKKLVKLKLAELKEICYELDIAVSDGPTNRKNTYILAMEALVDSCQCAAD